MLIPIVRFYVPVGSGNDARCGTGVPISDSLVLTAHHVVYPEHRNEKPIEVNWYIEGCTEKGSGFQKIVEVVCSDSSLDFALIRCNRPREVSGFAKLADSWPSGGQRWQSNGFITAGSMEFDRPAISFSGTVEGVGHGGAFQIVSGSNPSLGDKKPSGEAWQGASGMPVCLNGTNNVIGLVKEVPEVFEGTRLNVVPSFKIMNHEKFKAAIKNDDTEYQALYVLRRKALADHVTETIKSFPPVLGSLAAQFMPEQARISSATITPEDITEKILDASIVDLGRYLHTALIEVNKRKGVSFEEKNKLLDSIRSIGYLVGPFRFGVLHGPFVHEYFNKKPRKLARVEGSSPLTFEMLMAEVDERELEPRKRVLGSGSYPPGTRSFSELPEFGRVDMRDKIRRLIEDIEQKLVPGNLKEADIPQLGNSVVEAVGAVIWPEKDSSEADTEARKRMLNIKLGAKTTGTGRYYFPIRLPKNGNLRSQLESELNKVAEWLDEFVFIGYESSSVIEETETEKLERFSQIIPEDI